MYKVQPHQKTVEGVEPWTFRSPSEHTTTMLLPPFCKNCKNCSHILLSILPPYFCFQVMRDPHIALTIVHQGLEDVRCFYFFVNLASNGRAFQNGECDALALAGTHANWFVCAVFSTRKHLKIGYKTIE